MRFSTGYTQDNRIFFRFEAPSQDGTPLQATLVMERHEAAELSKQLQQAVDQSYRNSSIITVN